MFALFLYCLPMAMSFFVLCFWGYLLFKKKLTWRKGAVLSIFLSLALGGSWFSLCNGFSTWCGSTCGVIIKRKKTYKAESFANGKILVECNGRQYPSVVAVQLDNDKLRGEGLDSLGQFAIEGQLKSSGEIRFIKKYTSDAIRRGAVQKPIAFYGELSQVNGKTHAKGMYKFDKKVGYEQSIHNPMRWIPVSGTWKGVFNWSEISRS